MDIALCLDRLVPGVDWQGSVTANTLEAFDAIRWKDKTPKPSWSAVLAKWETIKDEPEPMTLKEELDDLKARITKMETKQEAI